MVGSTGVVEMMDHLCGLLLMSSSSGWAQTPLFAAPTCRWVVARGYRSEKEETKVEQTIDGASVTRGWLCECLEVDEEGALRINHD